MSNHALCHLAGIRKKTITKIPTLIKGKTLKTIHPTNEMENEVKCLKQKVEQLSVDNAQSQEIFKEIAGECAASKEYIAKINEVVHELQIASIAPKMVKIDEVVQSQEILKEIAADCAASKEYIAKLNEVVHEPKVAFIAPKMVKLDEAVHDLKANFAISKIAIQETFHQECYVIEVKTFHLSKILPCMTLPDLDFFLLQVTDSESCFNALVAYLQSFFGKNLDKSIKKSLDIIMHKNVQKKLSWSGLRTHKPSFELEYKQIVQAMHSALKDKYKNYEYDSLALKVKTLLQGA